MARLLRMPEVAANTVEAVLSDWPVAENTPFAAEFAIATVETDKAVVDVPAETDGVILKTLVAAGSTVKVGDPIALLGDPGEAPGDLDALLAELGVGEARNGNASTPSIGRIFASPLARRLARDAGLSIADLVGTGPGGRIIRRDVQRAVAEAPVPSPAQSATSPAQPATSPSEQQPTKPTKPALSTVYVDHPHTRMRRTIAARLTQSTQEAPHFTVRGTARVDKLLRLRARLNAAADRGVNQATPVKISINDLIVLATARAHTAVPAMNVIWTPDAVRSFSSVDLSVAVATDRGLLTPVLRGLDRMTASAVAAVTGDLVARARAGRLRQDELEGGTLTVTNLGVFGTEEFSAIINPPQAAILAVGAARQEPLVHNGKLTTGTTMKMTLSVDHRPVDGAVAAEWMKAFLALVENPLRILM